MIDNEIHMVSLLGNLMRSQANSIEPLYTIIIILLLYYSRNSLLNYVYLGGIIVIYSNNLILTWIGLEIMALATTTILGKGSKSQGIRYYIMSSVGSIIIIYSILENYIRTDSFTILEFGIGILIGFLVKLGIPPLHQWKIDILNTKEVWLVGLLTILVPIPIYCKIIEIEENKIIEIGIILSWVVGTILGYIFSSKSSNNICQILGCSSLIQLGWFLFVLPFNSIFWMYLYFCNMIIVIILLCPYDNSQSYPSVYLNYWFNFWILSLAGFPPTLGFFTKLYVIYNNLLLGNFFLTLLSIIVSIFSFYIYYSLISVVQVTQGVWIKILITSTFTFILLLLGL